MRRNLLLLIILFFPVQLTAQFLNGPEHCKQKYYLSACAMFQQEARFLKEWIEYHKLVGVEHFYLYNNNSTDDFLTVLAPYIESGEVEYFWWPSDPKRDWTHYQIKAIKDAVDRAKLSSRWLAIIDIDEFIVPNSQNTLIDFLAENENQYNQILVMWRFFGTSWVERIPEDKLMVETLIRRTSFVPGEIWLHKAIVKPQTVLYPNVHDCGIREGGMCLNLAKAQEEYPPLLIHHYWTRDIEFLEDVKRERQERLHQKPWTEEELEHRVNAYNQVEDLTMMRFVPALRETIFKESL
ncbi:MAG: hypothetical protein K940chlam3_00059 [Chlamydiae bacterium]|nr:hypothetical protein [Chlamydiota bacterium]